MAKMITQVRFSEHIPPKALRVAAYGRVSASGEAMHHSLSQQISCYSKLIQSHGGWVFCGIFADEARTGTKDNREGFQKMLEQCRAGNIDMIITKSVTRFARNTLTMLNTVRELKELGVDVYFEEQNIHTMSADGELLLTILASFAQEESLSISENQKWRIRHNFENGRPWCGEMLGYRLEDGKYAVIPEEAAVVKRIFDAYLAGDGIETIAKRLNEDEIPTRKGCAWHIASVSRILTNYTYTGNLLLQRFYSENHLSKKKMTNNGEKRKYLVSDSHEPIIDTETFAAVQREMKRRAEKYKPKPAADKPYAFTSKIVCAKCGRHYRRKSTATGPVWICGTYNSQGKAACPSKAIPEQALIQITDKIPFDSITADDGNTLRIRYDGKETVLHWKDRSRAEAWTPEKREAARRKELERIGKAYA